ncbi:hypothetical protein QYF36_006423 [Acer negundo]|nr:hypothetical protein QYF36_006423 [Acer negundo]
MARSSDSWNHRKCHRHRKTTKPVSSKDITISQNPLITARIYLPKLLTTQHDQKLPVLVYFHGGGFCFESAYSLTETKLINSLVSEAKIVAISIEYRLAPENPLPIPHKDCWAPGLLSTGAGANLAHYTLVRAGNENLHGWVKIFGAFLTHPYFWGSDPVGSEIKAIEEREKLAPFRVWKYLYPSPSDGIDNVMVNPFAPEKPCLGKQIGCSRLLVSVAELDLLRDRGILYVNAVKESGFKGGVLELVQVDGEDHAFHILNYESENAKKMIKSVRSMRSNHLIL